MRVGTYVQTLPTEINPADIGTRTGKTKSEKSYWLQGPDFLLQRENTLHGRPTESRARGVVVPGGSVKNRNTSE